MATPGENATVDTVDALLDQAGDAVARNEWKRARELAESVFQQTRHHPEAELIIRTATAYLETERAPADPLSGSKDLRFMSIMFCDVVQSTRLAGQLGDAVWRNTLERFRRRCARAVRRYDGYIHEAVGDELLILFGYPRVREDDARRAVLAGLDVVAAIESFSALLEREHGTSFKVRVGIHTGRALIREGGHDKTTGGAGREIGSGLVGEAAHIAKRVEADAAPNTVWVSGATRRIVEGFFEFSKQPEGEKRVRLGPAVATTVTAYQVNARTAALNRHQIARVRSDDIVGRPAERQRLLMLWAQARTAGAPFVVVRGQAGIGKSRLVEFLADTVAGGQGSRIECICTEMQKPVAFAPLIGLLERFANIREADDAQTRHVKLSKSFRELGAGFAELVPYLAWMMSIPAPENAEGPENARVEELEPEAIRKHIFDHLIQVLKLSASVRPSLFWIEDVQWADASTLEFCRQLATHGPIPGLLVVATLRTTYPEDHGRVPWFDDGPPSAGVVTIDLGPLSPEESRELIEMRSGSAPDEKLVKAILDSAGGNPLYLEEVVRSLGPDVRHRTDSSEQLAVEVPESLQPIFAQIVDRLDRDRPVAQMASLLGRDLPEPLTRTVIARILGMTEDDVVLSLSRLIDVEIVEPLLTELNPGYRFRHELIREALAYSVGPDSRENHGRIAHVIEASFPLYKDERPALLAYHFTKAENHARAAHYRHVAGDDLQSRAAHEEAIASFDQGLESLSHVAEGASAPDRARLELSLLASRGVSIQTIKGYADGRAGRDWARVYELSRQLEARETVVPALLGLWSFYFVRGAHKTSIEVAVQMIGVADALTDLEAGLIGHVCLGYSRYFQGDLPAGRESVEYSQTLREGLKDSQPHHHVPQDPALAGLSLLGPARWSLGDQNGALRAAEESIAIASASKSKRAINLARVGQFNAWLHQIRRKPEEALDAAEQALAIAHAYRIEWAVVNLSIHKGLALAHLPHDAPRSAEGRALVKQYLAYWRAAGPETMVPYFLGELGEAHLAAGDREAALELVNEAITLGDRIGEHCHDAELYRVRGQIRLTGPREDRSKGLEDLRRAVATAGAQRAVSFEIRSLVSLLTADPDSGDRDKRIAALEDALQRLESNEHGIDESEARAVIAKHQSSEGHR